MSFAVVANFRARTGDRHNHRQGATFARADLIDLIVDFVSRLELFSNSPVWWLCGDRNPSGSPTGGADNLAAGNHARHATYMATVAAYAASRWNISFQSVEAFNEPIAGWWKASGTQEGCHFDHSTQAEVAVLLRRELDAQGLHAVAVAASDENTYDMALATWKVVLTF